MISTRLRSRDKKAPLPKETQESTKAKPVTSKKRKTDLNEASSSKKKQKRAEEEQDNGNGKKKAKANDIEPTEEKRLRSYRSKCPSGLLPRMQRARTQRMFCLEQRHIGAHSREYDVLGSTGNVYTVNMKHIPTCNCPDQPGAGIHCKHILFVLMKVLKAKKEYVYQAALLSKELEEIFTANTELSAMASKKVVDTYKAILNDEILPENEIPQKELSDCPICFEECTEADRDKCVFCETCLNNIHKECFKVWMNTKKAKHEEVTCVYCRSEWPDANSAESKAANHEGYINLGAEAGLPASRDYSSYDPYLVMSNWRY